MRFLPRCSNLRASPVTNCSASLVLIRNDPHVAFNLLSTLFILMSLPRKTTSKCESTYCVSERHCQRKTQSGVPFHARTRRRSPEHDFEEYPSFNGSKQVHLISLTSQTGQPGEERMS